MNYAKKWELKKKNAKVKNYYFQLSTFIWLSCDLNKMMQSGKSVLGKNWEKIFWPMLGFLMKSQILMKVFLFHNLNIFLQNDDIHYQTTELLFSVRIAHSLNLSNTLSENDDFLSIPFLAGTLKISWQDKHRMRYLCIVIGFICSGNWDAYSGGLLELSHQFRVMHQLQANKFEHQKMIEKKL